MLHFNNLRYYVTPPLLDYWEHPTWLTIELGIFAGRLYFEYKEYDDLCRSLGLHTTKLSTNMDENPTQSEPSKCEIEDVDTSSAALQSLSFCSKPLTFLQKWLAMKRR